MLLFWLMVVAAFILIEASIAWEVHIWAVAGLVVVVATAVLLGMISWAWFVANPGSIVAVVVLYLVGGVVWGFIKWYFHLLNVKDNVLVNSMAPIYKRNYESGKNPDETYYAYLVRVKVIPLAFDNKYLISVWMAWWPFSVLYTLFDDVVRRFYNWIVDTYLVIFNAISAHVFKGL